MSNFLPLVLSVPSGPALLQPEDIWRLDFWLEEAPGTQNVLDASAGSRNRFPIPLTLSPPTITALRLLDRLVLPPLGAHPHPTLSPMAQNTDSSCQWPLLTNAPALIQALEPPARTHPIPSALMDKYHSSSPLKKVPEGLAHNAHKSELLQKAARGFEVY